jgi:outer membrane protein OmpA-like peptidoglycan-associated protein
MVLGGRLALSALGQGASRAKRDRAVPAKLTFTAIALESARGKQLGSRKLGALLGEVALSGQGTDVQLVISREASAGLLDAPATALDRKLRLELTKPTAGIDTLAGKGGARLVVPADLLEGAKHLELHVELEVDGGVEASEQVNDVLDVPLVPRPLVLVQLVDEVGAPLAGVPIELGAPSKTESLTTDDAGRAQIDDLGDTDVTLVVSDDSALRAELKQRWAKPQVGGILAEADETLVRFLDDVTSPVELGELTSVRISVQPRVILARVLGLIFETNKSFVLPTALPDLKGLRALSDEDPDSELLIVGHTDTSADAATNDPLSLERAESVVAYLKQDIDTWLGRYEDKTPKPRRWGANEDSLMVSFLPPKANGEGDEEGEEELTEDEAAARAAEDPISRFQRTRGLEVDGKAGPKTRRQLITEYLARDEEILPEGTPMTAHGAGENFPVDASGEELDATPADGTRDATDRRVEIYFFDKEFGIQPAPPGNNSKAKSREYPEWRRRAKLRQEADLRFSNRVLKLRMQLNDKDLVDEEYAVDVDGRRLAVARTDDKGFLEQRLPVGAKVAEIRMPQLNLLRTFDLVPSEEFPPVDDLRGVQQRLMQMGFLPKEADGKFDTITASALRSFRTSRGLSDEAVLDDETKAALTDAYGS